MRCEDVNIKIVDLLEKSLDSESESILKEHISSCKECRNHLAFVEGTLGVIEKEKDFTVSDDFSDIIIEKLNKPVKNWTLRRTVLTTLTAAAVVIFGIFTGIFISDIMSGNNPDMYADLPDEYYYANEIHLETIEGFFLTNDE